MDKFVTMYWILLFVAGCDTLDSGIKEYCSTETFSPSCNDGSVLVIEHAQYGRMRIGQCVKDDYGLGTIGCAKSVMNELNAKCFGREHCEVDFLRMGVQLDCLKEMSPYLEASYTCISVVSPTVATCSSPLRIEASSADQHISSLVTKRTSCGLSQTPYILEARPGQRIELSVHMHSSNQVCADNLGYILDRSNDDVINLCTVFNSTYMSKGHQVQVLMEPSVLEKSSFLVTFTAKGCPDIETPAYANVERSQDKVTITCLSSSESWNLKCVGNIWLGIRKNCSKPFTTKDGYTVSTPVIHVTSSQQSTLPHISNYHLYAIAIGCFTLIVCCVTVVIGIHCVKRYELSTLKKSGVDMSGGQKLLHPVQLMPATDWSTMYPPTSDIYNSVGRQQSLLNL